MYTFNTYQIISRAKCQMKINVVSIVLNKLPIFIKMRHLNKQVSYILLVTVITLLSKYNAQVSFENKSIPV